MDALDETADFLDSLGHFFLGTSDASIRQAFMEVFSELLRPLCEVRTTKSVNDSFVSAHEKVPA
jgi:hypothetical protein